MGFLDKSGLSRFWANAKQYIDNKVASIFGNVTGAEFAQKTMTSQPDTFYPAESTDGVAYTATVPGVTSLYPGLKVTLQLNKTSTSTQPTLNLNGLGAKAIRQPLTTNSFSSTTAHSASWLNKAAPITVIYNGTLWRTDFYRPSATTLYGTVGIDHGGTGASNAADALTNLGAVSQTEFNAQIAALQAQIDALK